MKLCLITGASSGIGFETARALAEMGHHVVIVSRDPERGETARAGVAAVATAPVEFVQADLGSLDGVRALAARVLDTYPRIDVLISNAGTFNAVHRESADGFEKTFAVNHLAPFLLTNLLLDRLHASSPARVVITASAAHHGVRMPADPLAGPARGWRAYQTSKLANIMFTYALARRLAGTDLIANCLHPGFVRTRLGSGNGVPIRPVYWLLYPFTISQRAGARTPVYLATSDEVEDLSGLYFENLQPVPSSRASYDEEAQERLWDASARATGLA